MMEESVTVIQSRLLHICSRVYSPGNADSHAGLFAVHFIKGLLIPGISKHTQFCSLNKRLVFII